MKSLNLILYLVVYSMVSYAQNDNISTQLISTASGYSQNTSSGNYYAWSIGEISTASVSNSTKILFVTQGQQQPFNASNDIDITVYNGITVDDNNNQNNVFTVKNIEKYPNNKLTVFNRWGEIVYQMTGYNNTWEGKDHNGSYLETGTYYYVLHPDHVGSSVVKGQLLIIRP